jgi:hypothetical protein
LHCLGQHLKVGFFELDEYVLVNRDLTVLVAQLGKLGVTRLKVPPHLHCVQASASPSLRALHKVGLKNGVRGQDLRRVKPDDIKSLELPAVQLDILETIRQASPHLSTLVFPSSSHIISKL